MNVRATALAVSLNAWTLVPPGQQGSAFGVAERVGVEEQLRVQGPEYIGDAIAGLGAEDLSADSIVPSPLDPRVARAVTAAVAAAVESNVSVSVAGDGGQPLLGPLSYPILTSR